MNLKDIFDFRSSLPNPDPALLKQYQKFYKLNIANMQHEFEIFASDQYTICGHIFTPKHHPIEDIMVFIHGYGDHIGLHSNLIRYCMEHNIALACAELPGHGLSSGKRFDINNFDEYIAVQKKWIEIINLKFSSKINKTLMGYSTGGSILLSLLQDQNIHKQFNKFICIAPLVKIPNWSLIELTVSYLPFVKIIRRYFADNSYDKNICDFIANKDPQTPSKIPMSWFAALIRWQKEFEKFTPQDIELEIFQGIDDTVVAWENNIIEIAKRFVHHNIHLLPHAKHNLLNELDPVKNKIFNKMISN